MYLFGTIRAARKIHGLLIDAILGATLRYVVAALYTPYMFSSASGRVLDTTPVSRFITRCTVDTRAVDGPLADFFGSALSALTEITLKLVAIVIMTPAFLLPSLVTFLIGRLCGQIYTAAQLAITRVQSVKKAPVLGNFGVAIAGLSMFATS